MKPIPLLDYLGTPLFVVIFLLLLWLQQRRPLRRLHFPVFRRMVRNFVFSSPGFLLARLAMIPIPLTVAWWADTREIGLLHWLNVPPTIAGVLGFFLMDWSYYWWHYATHRVPLLWRFHIVHHTDLDLDVSTAARFHFGEIILSVPFRCAAVLLFGIPVPALLVYELAFESATFFHHSNWRLPLALERALNRVVVTPRMHGIHHSIVKRETDSNWGTIFSFWDRLHRTLRIDIAQDDLTIGVAAWRNEGDLTVGKLLGMPFGKQREWRLPTGEVPEREPKPASDLAP